MRSFLTSVLLLMLCTPLNAASVPVDDEFYAFGVRFQDNSTIMVLAAHREINGKLAICGVYFVDGGTPREMREIAPAYVKQLAFTIGETQVPKKTWRFNRVKNHADPAGQSARCTVLNVAWSDQMARMPLRGTSTQQLIRGN